MNKIDDLEVLVDYLIGTHEETSLLINEMRNMINEMKKIIVEMKNEKR
jgi:hypothetical protein